MSDNSTPPRGKHAYIYYEGGVRKQLNWSAVAAKQIANIRIEMKDGIRNRNDKGEWN